MLCFCSSFLFCIPYRLYPPPCCVSIRLFLFVFRLFICSFWFSVQAIRKLGPLCAPPHGVLLFIFMYVLFSIQAIHEELGGAACCISFHLFLYVFRIHLFFVVFRTGYSPCCISISLFLFVFICICSFWFSVQAIRKLGPLCAHLHGVSLFICSFLFSVLVVWTADRRVCLRV